MKLRGGCVAEPSTTAPVVPLTSTPVAAEETIWRGSPAWTLVIGRAAATSWMSSDRFAR